MTAAEAEARQPRLRLSTGDASPNQETVHILVIKMFGALKLPEPAKCIYKSKSS